MRKLIKAWSTLVGSNAANGVLQLLIFAVAARALSLEALGLVVMIQAYVRLIDGVFNFQSVNVLTNLLAEAQTHQQSARFRGLIKAGLLIDLATALAATAIAVLGVLIAGSMIGIAADWLWLALAYCGVILTRSFGAAEAGLRCFDRFAVIGLRPVIVSLVLLASTALVWLQGGDAKLLLLLWLIGEAVANIAFLLWSLGLLSRDGAGSILAGNASEAIRTSTGFWATMWRTNVTFGLRTLSQEGDVLIVGSVLGEAAAALLKAAKNLAVLVGQFGKPLHQAASVPVSQWIASGAPDRAFGFALRTSLAVAACGLLVTAAMAFATPSVLTLAFGPSFVDAYWLVLGLLIAKTLYLAGATLPPTMIALDITRQFTAMIVVGNLAFFGALLGLIGPLGVLAAVVANVAFELVWAVMGWAVTAKEIARRKPAGLELRSA